MNPRHDIFNPESAVLRGPASRRAFAGAVTAALAAAMLAFFAGCSEEPEPQDGGAQAGRSESENKPGPGEKAFASAFEGASRDLEGDLEGSIRAYEEAYRLSPASPTLCRALAEAYQKAKRTGQALELLHRHAALHPDDSHPCLLAAALILDSEGKAAEAEAEIDRLMALKPGDPAAYRGVADRYIEMGHPLKAAQALIRLGAASGNPSAAAAEAAGMLMHNGHFSAAAEIIDPALAQNPSDFELALLKARCLAAVRETAAASAEYLALLGSRPDDASLQSEAASFFAGAGRHEEAARILSAAAAKFASDGRIQRQLAAALLRTGKKQEALGALDAALEADSGDPDALLLRAAILEESGRAADAERDALRALAARPSDARAKHFLAFIWSVSGKEGALAAEYAYYAARKEPDIAVYQATAGLAASRSGDAEKAVKLFSKALAAGDDAYVYWLYSIHLGLAGRPAEAAEYAGKAAALDSRFGRQAGEVPGGH